MLKNIHIGSLFFYLFFGAVIVMALSFVWPFMMYIGLIAVLSLLALTVADILLVFSLKGVSVKRDCANRLDLDEPHSIGLEIINGSPQPIFGRLYEYAPKEAQMRDLYFDFHVLPGKEKRFTYTFTPKTRGVYTFGNAHLMLRSLLNLVQREIIFSIEEEVKVYPSVAAMRKMEFAVFTQQSNAQGIKKIRRLGHNSEFEQIKNYVQGDEIKTINWKATSKRHELMVNQYQAERSQAIYAVVDKSRSMEKKYNGMSLLDHAINATLVFSNVAIKKGDKFGMLSFAEKVDNIVAADGKLTHLRKVLEALYNEQTTFLEANYDLLFQIIRKKVTSRATFILFTNFETEAAMRRVLPLLRQINQKHNLVVIFFENTELENVTLHSAESMRDVYVQQVAQDIINVRKRIAKELNRNGIQTVLSKPENLSVDTVNKYLVMKAKGLV